MRVAIVADSHFSERSRFDECKRIHTWILDDIVKRGVHLVLHAGDMYDERSTPMEREAVAVWLQEVAEHAAVVIVRGNHDRVRDVPLMRKLSSRMPIHVVEDACIVEHDNAAIACLAWPQEAFAAQMAGNASIETRKQGISDSLRSVLMGFQQKLRSHNGPRILLSHAMVRGATTSFNQELVGCDMEVGSEDLAQSGADFVALGHIHKHQTFGNSRGIPIVYTGSPYHKTFGETETKGYVVADFENDRVNWEFVATPATPMILVDARYDDSVGSLVGDGLECDVCGAEVRLRYIVDAAYQDAAASRASAIKMRWMTMGARSVKIEPRLVVHTRSRAPEIARAITTAEKLKAYWNANPPKNPPDVRKARLLANLAVIEGQLSA